MSIDFQKYLTQAIDAVIRYAPSLISALVILFGGFWAVKKLNKVVSLSLSKTGITGEIASFLASIADISLKFAVVLFAAGVAGFDTSALIGMLAAAGFAIGLALQGGLGNFASGIIILIFKPYKVGDWISLNDKFGKVEEIQIFNTLLVTPGLKTLIIPNGKVTDNIVTNFSKKGQIRLEIKVMMPYTEAFPNFKAVIDQVLDQSSYVLKNPLPVVGIESFDAINVSVGVRPYVHPDQYWDATYAIQADLKAAFAENKIQIAYPEAISLGKIG